MANHLNYVSFYASDESGESDDAAEAFEEEDEVEDEDDEDEEDEKKSRDEYGGRGWSMVRCAGSSQPSEAEARDEAMEVDIATLTSGYVDTGTEEEEEEDEEEEDEVMEGVEEGWSGSDDDNTLRSVESEMLKVGDD
jgi:hypothetical protein